MNETTDTRAPETTRHWKSLFASSCVGLLVLLVQFPKFTRHITRQVVDNPNWRSRLLTPVNVVQDLLRSLIGPASSDLLRRVVAIDFIALWIFLILLIVFSFRHTNKRLFGFGVVGMSVGYFGLHLVSWSAVILLYIIKLIGIIYTWMLNLINAFFSFLASYGWWIIVTVSILAILFFLSKDMFKAIFAMLSVFLLTYIIYLSFPPILNYISELTRPLTDFLNKVWNGYSLPLLGFIFRVVRIILTFVFTLMAVFGVLTTLGRLLIDQFRATWSVGKGEKQMALGTFAIGSALALVVLTSVATPPALTGVNAGWQESLQAIDSLTQTHIASNLLGVFDPTRIFVATMPEPVRSFVFTYLTSVPPPLIESIILLFITSSSIISITFSLFPSISEEPVEITDYYFPRAYLNITVGLIAPVLIIFARSLYMEE